MLGPNIQYFAQHGVRGIFEEGSYGTSGGDMDVPTPGNTQFIYTYLGPESRGKCGAWLGRENRPKTRGKLMDSTPIYIMFPGIGTKGLRDGPHALERYAQPR